MSLKMAPERAPDVSSQLETEADAYAFLERLRWGNNGPTACPHCTSDKGAWFLNPRDPEGRKSKGGTSARSHRRVWKCKENTCRRQFSVLTNTVMHATKMPVRAWVGVIVEMSQSPNGVSAREIAATWGIAEKSAWNMLLRIEQALAVPPTGDHSAVRFLEIDRSAQQVVERPPRPRDVSQSQRDVDVQQVVSEALRPVENSVSPRSSRADERRKKSARARRNRHPSIAKSAPKHDVAPVVPPVRSAGDERMLGGAWLADSAPEASKNPDGSVIDRSATSRMENQSSQVESTLNDGLFGAPTLVPAWTEAPAEGSSNDDDPAQISQAFNLDESIDRP